MSPNVDTTSTPTVVDAPTTGTAPVDVVGTDGPAGASSPPSPAPVVPTTSAAVTAWDPSTEFGADARGGNDNALLSGLGITAMAGAGIFAGDQIRRRAPDAARSLAARVDLGMPAPSSASYGELRQAANATNLVRHPIDRFYRAAAAHAVGPSVVAMTSAGETTRRERLAGAPAAARAEFRAAGAVPGVGRDIVQSFKGVNGALSIGVGLAFQVPKVVQAIRDEGYFGPRSSAATGHAVGAITGSITGWAIGAKFGAAAGAALGTAVLPGLGTVLGAGAGVLLGGILGSTIGSWALGGVGDAIGGATYDLVT